MECMHRGRRCQRYKRGVDCSPRWPCSHPAACPGRRLRIAAWHSNGTTGTFERGTNRAARSLLVHSESRQPQPATQERSAGAGCAQVTAHRRVLAGSRWSCSQHLYSSRAAKDEEPRIINQAVHRPRQHLFCHRFCARRAPPLRRPASPHAALLLASRSRVPCVCIARVKKISDRTSAKLRL